MANTMVQHEARTRFLGLNLEHKKVQRNVSSSKMGNNHRITFHIASYRSVCLLLDFIFCECCDHASNASICESLHRLSLKHRNQLAELAQGEAVERFSLEQP